VTTASKSLLELAKARDFAAVRARYGGADPATVTEVAEYLREADLYQLAIELYRHLLRSGESALLHFGIGQCHGKIYEFDQALHHLQRAFTLEPDRVAGAEYYAYILERHARYAEAEPWYQRALGGPAGEDLWTRSHYAWFLEKAGRVDDAISWYQDVLRRNPGYTWAVKRLALLTLRRGDPERATAMMRDALERFPTSPFAKLNYLEYLTLREDPAAATFRSTLDAGELAPPFRALLDLLDIYRELLLPRRTDPTRTAAFEKVAAGLTDSVHRDVDDLTELLAARGGDIAEWQRLIKLLLK
jgi:tetratricopeptide (TPR) repeat protein